MIKILKENHNTILIFIIPLILVLIGFVIHRDYGISLDEEITRNNGLVSIKYICDLFFPQYANSLELIKNVPEIKNYADGHYGAFFEVLTIVITEIFFEIKNFSEIFYYRHLINHYLFIISVICFYFLCFHIFKNKLYAFFGSAFLYSTPRIFAESFYNSKDLAFLSFFIFLIFFSIKFLRKPNYYNAFLLSIFAALASNLRIVAFYVVFLIISFCVIEFLMKNKFDYKKINTLFFLLFFKLIFLYLLWPYLWENPIDNFIYTITSTQDPSRSWGGHIFYLGDFYKVFYIPWHYIIVNFFATTPILISILITCGLTHLLVRFFKRLMSIDNKNPYNDLWRGEKEKTFIFIFFCMFVPIFLIFLSDTILYNGWRHLFFLYPLLILISIYFIDILVIKFRNKKISLYINTFLTIILLSNIYNLITFHPFQYIYFNSIFEKKANKLLEVDYWGLSNKYSLVQLIKNNLEKNEITVGVASFTNLNISRKMLGEKYSNKIVIVGQDFSNADFIFSNNHFEIDPNYDDKYLIPNNYRKYSELKKGNILLNEFYAKE